MTTAIGDMGRSGAQQRHRSEWIVALISAWSVMGLALDGRVHQDGTAESFFTLPHAIIYSGIAAAGGWVFWMMQRARRTGEQPVGLALTIAGLVLLAAGGPLDLGWHTVFGIEAGVEALLSPTHLMLLAGGVLLLSAPLRAAFASGELRGRQSLPALASLTLVTAVVAFFFQYASPFHGIESFTSGGHDATEQGLTALAVTNIIMMAPVVLLAARFERLPFGTATLLFGGVAAVVTVSGESGSLALLAAALAGGVAADLLAAAVRPGAAEPNRIRIFAGLAPLPLWLAVFAAIALTDGLAWTVELWTGSVLLAGAAGLGLAVLALAGGRADSPPAPLSRRSRPS